MNILQQDLYCSSEHKSFTSLKLCPVIVLSLELTYWSLQEIHAEVSKSLTHFKLAKTVNGCESLWKNDRLFIFL